MLIEVTEFDPGEGKEYQIHEYPGEGVYYVARKNLLVVAYLPASCTALCGSFSPYTPTPVREQSSSGVPEDLVTRLLAVALHKDAALEAVRA